MSQDNGVGIARRHFLVAATAATAATAAATQFGGALAAAPAAAAELPQGGRNKAGGSILDAIKLGCHPMESVFNHDDHDIPWFGHQAVPDDATQTRFLFNGAFEEAHVPGRHLNGLLEARSLGIEVAEASITKHRDAAYFSLSREVPLPQNRTSLAAERPSAFLTHNTREGMHAMYALYQHSPANAAEARTRMEKMIAAIDRFWTPQRAWSRDALVAVQPDIDLQEWAGPFVSGLGRAIGPLAKYWRATVDRKEESTAARALLAVLRDEAMKHFDAAGVGVDLGGHTHSITCTMSGMAQLADFTDDDELLERVWAFYRVGLTDMRDELGWSQENMGDNSDRGEVNNSGDILETALILGRRGHPECLPEADRIIRAHILPCQLTDASWMPALSAPWDDSSRDVGERTLGAFGFPAPYGHRPRHHYAISFNMDIVGGATGSLCAAQREIVRRDGDRIVVGLQFDTDNDIATVESPYGAKGGSLRVTPKAAGDVVVPLARWVDRSHVRVTGAKKTEFDADGSLVVRGADAGKKITISFDRPEREINLGHRDSGIRVRLSGDEVTAMESFGQELAFFDELPKKAPKYTARGEVAHWAFATAAGDQVPDDSGNTLPAALFGTGRIGADAGGPPGHAGAALLLDGQGFAGPGFASELNFGARSFTVALWLRTGMTGIGRLLSKGSYNWTPGWFVSVGHGGDGHLGFGISAGQRSGAVGAVEMWSRDAGLNDNTWHHVAVIVDRDQDRIQLVVDGAVVPVAKGDVSLGGASETGLALPPNSPIVASSRNALTIGSYLGQAESFVGAIADVRLFDQALTPQKVAGLR